MSQVMESQNLTVIRIWVALAWADGVILESERRAIGLLITAASLSEEEREIASSLLDSKTELATDSVSGLAKSAREGVFRAAVRMALVDLNMAVEEAEMLERLRVGLGIDAVRAACIKKEVPGS